ncbi:MAG: SusD/RagB family nutrient-binding outer membrane lipoprotein, partial [Mediterranea sp.]|nr:SusD/RagB family nutrient-binding outer membrane lipoprotein [Mediterranea sp.]
INSHPVWQTIVQAARTDYSPTQFFINTLEQFKDPRIDLLFKKNIYEEYSGGIPGQGNNFADLSPLSATWLQNTLPVNLLDYAEAEFLLAEAEEQGIDVDGTAEEHYKKAIKASVIYWGGTDQAADDYLEEPAIQYLPADWEEKIGYQKWIAFAERGWDAWTEIRRLGHPNIDTLNPPVGANGKLPQRFNYPPVEQTSNPDNWQNAVKAIEGGQDVVSAKLFWKK